MDDAFFMVEDSVCGASSCSTPGVCSVASGGGLPVRPLRAVLKMESIPWSDLTSVNREADASQSSGMRRALRSITSERAANS